MGKKKNKIIRESKKQRDRKGNNWQTTGSYNGGNKKQKTPVEERYLADYRSAINSRGRRPFSLKYFAQPGYTARDLAEYQYEIDKLRWYTDPHNLPKLIDIAKETLVREFGEDANERYGLPNKYRHQDIPHDEPSRGAERYVFPFSDDFLVGLRKSPKIPIGDWEERKKDRMSTIKTRKYLCMVDGEVLLGEMTVEEEHSHDSIVKNAMSGVKFCIYYRGLEEGKFIVERWDYEPLSKHPNKFDANNCFCINGVFSDKVEHSHRHIYNQFMRVILTQNQSPDIKPTPINYKSKDYSQKEQKYATFADMVHDFKQEMHIESVQIPRYEVTRQGLRSVGKDFCVNYNTYSKSSTPGERYRELRKQAKVPPKIKTFEAGLEEEELTIEPIIPSEGKVKATEQIIEEERLIAEEHYKGTQISLEEIYGPIEYQTEDGKKVLVQKRDGQDQITMDLTDLAEGEKTAVEKSEDKGGQSLWLI